MRHSFLIRAGLFSCAVAALAATPCAAQTGMFGPTTHPAVAWPMPALPQSGAASGIADRIEPYSRNSPDREDRIHIAIDNADAKKAHFKGIFGGLGQASGIAFGLEVTTADSIPGVELSATAITSTRLYRQFELESYFPSVGSENTHADVRFRYLRRTKDNFYGLGPDVGGVPFAGVNTFEPFRTGAIATSSEFYETNYDLEKRQTSFSLYHDFTDDLQAGVYADYTSSSTYVGDDDNDPPIDTFFGPGGLDFSACFFPGGCQSIIGVPGLFEGSKILSEGVYFEYDGRNNEDGLTKGFYAYGRFANHDAVGRIDVDYAHALVPTPGVTGFARITRPGNDFGWFQTTFDLRGYIPLGTDRLSLALRYFTDLNSTKGDSAIPFYEQPKLGGRSTLRGFDNFRFTGENAILFQGEIRGTVWKKEKDSGVDLVVFGDTGQVWGVNGLDDTINSFLLTDLDNIDTDNFEADGGLGLQYRYNKDFTIRVDFGHSNETNKVWFSFTRGF